uniref:Putative secreted protein n=1 Tax=Ixodes ricinus TaxID=34613 RepID=A0A6B0UEJ1_IXORI
MLFHRRVWTRTGRWRFITGIAFSYPGGVHQCVGCSHQMTSIITEGLRNPERCESKPSYPRSTASDIEALVNKSTEERHHKARVNIVYGTPGVP